MSIVHIVVSCDDPVVIPTINRVIFNALADANIKCGANSNELAASINTSHIDKTETFCVIRNRDRVEATSDRVPLSGRPATHQGATPTTEKLADGQYKDHWVLSEFERAKGFVRPIRLSYKHDTCKTTTSMPRTIAETYATNPGFYNSTYCSCCRDYFPVSEFTWTGTNERVGS